MAEISAGLVKELREKTGAGMMDCKKALTETGGVLTLSSGDNYLPGPEFNASLARPEGEPIYDAEALVDWVEGGGGLAFFLGEVPTGVVADRYSRRLSLAVDNAVCLALGYNDRGVTAANHHVCPIHPEYADIGPSDHDPDAARALMEEAGMADFEHELVSIDDTWRRNTADAVAAQLRVQDMQFARHADGSRVFTGQVVNPTQRDLRNVQLQMGLYDADNRLVDEATVRVPISTGRPSDCSAPALTSG